MKPLAPLDDRHGAMYVDRSSRTSRAKRPRALTLNPDGSPSLNAGALKRSIDRYGPEKLDEIFGPGTTKQLNKILEVARDAKTQPPTRRVGSSTFANVMAFLEKGLTKVPVGGDLVIGAAKARR
jgi:hypothetical protein